MSSTNVNIRMDAKLKAEAEALFADLGLNMSTAVNMFIRQAVRQQALPFVVSRQPNAETYAAMQDVLAERNLSGPYRTAADLLAVLEDSEE